MKSAPPRFFLALPCTLLLTFSGLALGQVRQVQQGNLLDANPGVGTGRSNQPVPGYVPVNQNEVISGNVAGLQYFHVPTGVQSPYELRTNLGTSNLANFARQSAPVGPSALGQSYYLPSSTVSSSQGAWYSAPYGGGFDSQLVPRSAINPTVSAAALAANQPLAAGVPVQSFSRVGTAVMPVNPGGPGGQLSSPLFSLRLEPLPSGASLKGFSPATQPATMPALPNPQFAPGSTPLFGGAETQPADDHRDAASGHRLSDTYQSLLDELDKSARPGGARRDIPNAPGANLTLDIDPLTLRPRLMRPIAARTTIAATAPGRSTTAELPAARLEDQSTATLQAGKNIKPLASLTHLGAGQVTPFETLMANAENLLKQAKYLDAAEAYQTALAVQPDNALALVGRAHAELAAGLYQSASYDLKFLFTRKPEMLSVRYRMETFMPLTRQDYLARDLAGMTSAKETANLASFLYCYLCYQTGRDADLQTELTVWGNRPGRDSWQAVLHRAWGNSPSGR